jgi:hypothetical protein
MEQPWVLVNAQAADMLSSLPNSACQALYSRALTAALTLPVLHSPPRVI